MSLRALRLPSGGASLLVIPMLGATVGGQGCGGVVAGDEVSKGGLVGGGGAGSIAVVEAYTAEHFREAYAVLICSPADCHATKVGTAEKCRENVSKRLAGAPTATDGRFVYDAALGKTCLEGMKAVGCGDVFAYLEGSAACRFAFADPNAVEGAPCTRHTCASNDLYCRYDGNPAVCGSCAKKAFENEPCTNLSGCVDGLVCEEKVCVAKAVLGGPCTIGTHRCPSGSTCVDAGAGPRCLDSNAIRIGKIGDDCGETFCEEGAFCSWVTKKCVGPSEAGGACDFSTPDPCPPDQACDAAYHASGKCMPLVPEGGACESFAQCEPQAHCPDGTCIATKALGEPCVWHETCGSEWCDESGTCGPRPDMCQ